MLRFVDRILALTDGKIEAYGPREKLLRRPVETQNPANQDEKELPNPSAVPNKLSETSISSVKGANTN